MRASQKQHANLTPNLSRMEQTRQSGDKLLIGAWRPRARQAPAGWLAYRACVRDTSPTDEAVSQLLYHTRT